MSNVPPFVKSMAVYYDGLASGDGWKIVGRNFGLSQNSGSGTTDIGGTSRYAYTTVGAISRLACLLSSERVSSGSTGTTEFSGLTPTINQVCYEYSGVSSYDSKAGKINIQSDVSAPFVQTDGVGITIPAATVFYNRYYQTFPFLPSGTPTAAAAAGGSLAAQTWYYVVTRTYQGYESSPTSEFSATTSGGNLSIAITIVDTKSASADYYTVYRSSASGGTKQFLSRTTGPTKYLLDTGALSVDTTITPPASGQLYVLNRIISRSSDCSTHAAAGQVGSNQVGGTYTFAASGPSFVFGTAPISLLGDDRSGKSVLVLGDSIFSGVGFGQQSGYYRQVLGCWEASFNDGEINSLNWSFSGATLCEMVHPSTTGGGRSRLRSIAYADWVIDELGTNDITLTRTWQQLATDKLTIAAICAKLGAKYVSTTILPRVTQTTGCITIAGQSNTGTETARQNFNSWARAGFPVDGSGAPSMGGTPSPLIFGLIDTAASIEVNGSNAITLNGGFWQVPASPVISGLVLNGSPSATSLPVTTTLTTNANIGRVIKMTSGARNGQYCVVKSNTTTGITVYASGDSSMTGIAVPALSGAPAAGDTFDVYDSASPDGTHPGLAQHTALAAVIRAWLQAHVF